MAATSFYQPNPAAYMPYRQMQPQQSPVIWVNGEVQVENYPLAPNSTVVLWDSEVNTIYIKTTDMFGKSTIQHLDYVEREKQNTPKVEENTTPEYVTKADFENFVNKISEQISQLNKPNRKFKEEN